jgi:hypothetical protein
VQLPHVVRLAQNASGQLDGALHARQPLTSVVQVRKMPAPEHSVAPIVLH